MKKKTKEKLISILISLGLLGLIFFVLLLIHSVFIAGPNRVFEHEAKLYGDSYAERRNLRNYEYMNRFSLDDVYHIIKANDELHFFNEKYTRSGRTPYKSIDDILSFAQDLGFEKEDIQYGVYKNQIVYSLEKPEHIVLIDLEKLEVVLEFGA